MTPVSPGPGKADPHEQLGRPDRLGVGDVDPTDHPDLPEVALAPRPDRRSSGVPTAGRLGPWRMRSGSTALSRTERAGAQPLTLADGDGGAGQGPADVHGLHVDVQRLVEVPPPGEDGVDRLELLGGIHGDGGHDGLGQQLASEHDAPEPGRRIRGPEPPLTHRLEVERGVAMPDRSDISAPSPRRAGPSWGPCSSGATLAAARSSSARDCGTTTAPVRSPAGVHLLRSRATG